jgi:hypothetical protein
MATAWLKSDARIKKTPGQDLDPDRALFAIAAI